MTQFASLSKTQKQSYEWIYKVNFNKSLLKMTTLVCLLLQASSKGPGISGYTNAQKQSDIKVWTKRPKTVWSTAPKSNTSLKV